MKNTVSYGSTNWEAGLICFSYMLMSGITYFGFWSYDNWADDSLWILKYLLLALGVFFLLPTLNPKNWKAVVYFYADKHGLHFPPLKQGDPFIDVDWENVGEIKSETLYGGVNGISIELKLSKDQLDTGFKDAFSVNKVLGFNQYREGFYVVAYTNHLYQRSSDVIRNIHEVRRCRV